MYPRILKWLFITIVFPLFAVWLGLGFKGALREGSYLEAFNSSSDLALFTLTVAATAVSNILGLPKPCTWRRSAETLQWLGILLMIIGAGFYVHLASGGLVHEKAASFWKDLLVYPVIMATLAIITSLFVEIIAFTEEQQTSKGKS